MAFDFPYEAAIEALRGVVKTTWSIPDGSPIPESGNIPVSFEDYALPLAVLEAGGEVLVEDAGEGDKPLLSIGHTLTYYCWLLMETTQNADDMATLRTELTDLAKALIADRYLMISPAATVTTLRIIAVDWSGKGREWPVEVGEAGAMAGYVGVELYIEDS